MAANTVSETLLQHSCNTLSIWWYAKGL